MIKLKSKKGRKMSKQDQYGWVPKNQDYYGQQLTEVGGTLTVPENLSLFPEEEKIKHRHPNSARFHQLLGEIGTLHDLKQVDYGRGDDPFANVRSSQEWGVAPWVGAL